MPNYLVSYTECNSYSVLINAGNEDDAIEFAKEELAQFGTDRMRHVDMTDSFFQVEGEV